MILIYMEGKFIDLSDLVFEGFPLDNPWFINTYSLAWICFKPGNKFHVFSLITVLQIFKLRTTMTF